MTPLTSMTVFSVSAARLKILLTSSEAGLPGVSVAGEGCDDGFTETRASLPSPLSEAGSSLFSGEVVEHCTEHGTSGSCAALPMGSFSVTRWL